MNELMTTKMKKVKNKKGFTLIELIVVIAILGILAAIAIPRLGGFTERAGVSADEATIETIHNAVRIAQASPTGVTMATAGQPTVQELVDADLIEFPVPQSSDTAFSINYTSDDEFTIAGGTVTKDFD